MVDDAPSPATRRRPIGALSPEVIITVPPFFLSKFLSLTSWLLGNFHRVRVRDNTRQHETDETDETDYAGCRYHETIPFYHCNRFRSTSKREDHRARATRETTRGKTPLRKPFWRKPETDNRPRSESTRTRTLLPPSRQTPRIQRPSIRPPWTKWRSTCTLSSSKVKTIWSTRPAPILRRPT